MGVGVGVAAGDGEGDGEGDGTSDTAPTALASTMYCPGMQPWARMLNGTAVVLCVAHPVWLVGAPPTARAPMFTRVYDADVPAGRASASRGDSTIVRSAEKVMDAMGTRTNKGRQAPVPSLQGVRMGGGREDRAEEGV